jgi:hypothetical protein
MWIGLVLALTCVCYLFTCRTTGLDCGRMQPSITVRVRRIEHEGKAMPVSEVDVALNR